jgi:transcriptional regulator with XRE-family HTH domain
MIGERLRLLREAENLSQTQLAARLNVSKQAVSNWENNNITPAVEQIRNIAMYFGCTTDYLLEMDHKYRTIIEIDDLTPEQASHLRNIALDISKMNRAAAEVKRGKDG